MPRGETCTRLISAQLVSFFSYLIYVARFYAATAPLNGLTSGTYVVVHADGSVAANSPADDMIWNHASLEFTEWTGRYPPNNPSGDVVSVRRSANRVVVNVQLIDTRDDHQEEQARLATRPTNNPEAYVL